MKVSVYLTQGNGDWNRRKCIGKTGSCNKKIETQWVLIKTEQYLISSLVRRESLSWDQNRKKNWFSSRRQTILWSKQRQQDSVIIRIYFKISFCFFFFWEILRISFPASMVAHRVMWLSSDHFRWHDELHFVSSQPCALSSTFYSLKNWRVLKLQENRITKDPGF